MTHLPVLAAADVVDVADSWEVAHRDSPEGGRVITFHRDAVVSPSGEQMTREWIGHPGAVGVIALDDEGCVVVVRQYRHPVGMVMVEPPAGLLDAEGEAYADAAARELAEEARLAADHWRVLVDLVTSPGSSEESTRIFLATGLREAPRPDGFVLEGEEAHMDVQRVPVDDLVDAILAGRVQNPLLVSGVLALRAAGDRLDTLRPADAPWPVRTVRAERPAPADARGA
ncbi:NUDIX domain-containing protein [Mariniluteicoccus flavus]